jgi:hypothetical protein
MFRWRTEREEIPEDCQGAQAGNAAAVCDEVSEKDHRAKRATAKINIFESKRKPGREKLVVAAALSLRNEEGNDRDQGHEHYKGPGVNDLPDAHRAGSVHDIVKRFIRSMRVLSRESGLVISNLCDW